MEKYFARGIGLLILGLVCGCQTTPTPQPEDTTLHKTWSNVFLVEMGNAIANDDFETYVYYMSEYETALKEENQRTLQFLQADEDLTRYGDTGHQYYIETTMKMCAGDSASAYFYLTRYINVMGNRFLYNQDWKPIPDYAK